MEHGQMMVLGYGDGRMLVKIYQKRVGDRIVVAGMPIGGPEIVIADFFKLRPIEAWLEAF